MATMRKRIVEHEGREGKKKYIYWQVTYSTWVNDKDHPVRRTKQFLDHDEADAFRASVDAEITRNRLNGLEVPIGPEDWSIIKWLDTFAKCIKPNCGAEYFGIIVGHLTSFKDFLVARNVQSTRQLRREHIAEWTAAEQGRGLKPKSVSNALQVIRRAVRWGIDGDILDEKIGRKLPRVRVPRNKRRVLNAAEREQVIQLFADDPLGPVVLVGLYTGMRRGELAKLRTEHIHLDTGIITVQGDTAKAALWRDARIHDRIRGLLEAAVARGPGPVFHFRNKPMKADYMSRHFRERVRDKGLEGLTFHCLRHTHATALAAAGMNPFDIQRAMGHASITTTMIYVHLAKEQPPDTSVLA